MDTYNFDLKTSLSAPVGKSVKRLLDEFKSLYEEKLQRLESEIKCGSQAESLRMKVRILHSYVNDLSDQNQVLVQTVEDLEKEASEKVASLEVKLQAGDKSIHDLNHERRCLEEDNRHLRAELQALKADTFTLAQVMGVTLRAVPLERTTDRSAHSAQSPQKPGDLMKAQVEDLRNQLKAKNGIIQSLQEEIKTLLFHSAQKKNELLEKKEAMLLLRKPELETAQITSGDVIGKPHSVLWVAHQEAVASDGESRRIVEVPAEVGNPKEERVRKPSEQLRKQEGIVGRILNSQRPNELEMSKLTSPVEHPQLHQGKARNSSAHSTSQDPCEQKLCGPDNSRPCEADWAVLQDSSEGLQWNFSHQQERLLQSHKQLCLKREQVKRREEKAKAASPELQEREERMRQLQLDTASLQATQNCMRRALAGKEQQLVKEHGHTLQSLQNQLQTSEEKVNSLGLEVGLLKSKLQEKTEQSQQLRDQILKQQEALSRASATLKDTRRAAGNKIHKRENKLSVAQKQLQEAKKQLADCKKECLQKQKELEKLQEENAELTVQLKEHSQELHRLSGEKRKVELELTVITEKHRTNQQEVAGQDQVILQLKTELRVSEEKLQGAQKELVLQEAEVSRLNERQRRQQERLQELSEMCRQGDVQLDLKERDRQQLQSQLQLTQQQLKRQTERMERTERELTTSRQGHAADTERWSHRNLLLQKQLQHVQEQSAQHSRVLLELRDNLDQSQRALQLSQEKITVYEDQLKERGGEMSLVKQQLEEVQEELRESRTSAQSHQSTADIFKQKYMAAMEKVQQLQAQSQRMEEDAQLSKKQVKEAQAEVSSLRDEMASLESRYKKKASQMEHWEEAVEQLTEELQAALDSLRTREERSLRCEEEMQRLRVKVDSQQKQICGYEGKCLQLQTDFTSYQGDHSRSNEEYEALQKQLDLCQKALQQREEEVVQVKAELQHMLLTLHSRSEEVQEVREEVQKMLEEKQRKEEENQAVRNLLTLLDQQLHQPFVLCTDTADSVAGQEERAVFSSSLRTTEEQLSKSLEQRQSSYQLTQLHDLLQKLQKEASVSQKSLQKALEDAAEQQRRSCEAVAERDEAREQMRQQEALVCKLREELEQEHSRYEEQQHQLSKLKLHTADVGTEMDSLRITTQYRSDALVKSYEEWVLEQSQQPQHDQRECQESLEERHVLLKREHAVLQEKYEHNVRELQQLTVTLEEALTDKTHLQQERMQLVTIISQWIKQHKAASESLARRIKEQNWLLAAISREKEPVTLRKPLSQRNRDNRDRYQASAGVQRFFRGGAQEVESPGGGERARDPAIEGHPQSLC
ncbi:golgin subfamily A member 6-like protein 22 isoform X2 [Pygocentrus nattereri]|uniref:golgin subfamily A member 6-like protein 22 isoform X2 n=1 Tax=Pygocentrus nattereri TaxID=42514 RepID=UPI0018915657|nr:golgin subfamily A member 6-like protein 22 isoform X2 [Pygocentrus nattereri]